LKDFLLIFFFSSLKRHLNDVLDRAVRQCSLTGNEKICAKIEGKLDVKKEVVREREYSPGTE
jgi:hypothetical protein